MSNAKKTGKGTPAIVETKGKTKTYQCGKKAAENAAKKAALKNETKPATTAEEKKKTEGE